VNDELERIWKEAVVA